MSLRPLLLGHRGARAVKSIPENTLAAFDRALADGCDGFEFDVRLTADGRAVICHDEKLGKIEVARAVTHQLTTLPQLEEVLKRYRDSAFLDIELKVEGLEKLTAELLRLYTLRRGYFVSSFLPQVLRRMHAADPAVPLGLICETRAQLGRAPELPLQYLIPVHTLLHRKLVEEVKTAGRKIIVWTVNRPEDILRFAKWGVDGIVSDDTALLVQTFANPKIGLSDPPGS